MVDHAASEADFYLLGHSDDVGVLLDHLRAEAPQLLARVVVVVPGEPLVTRLRRIGVRSVRAEPWDLMALLDAGVEKAKIIVIFPENPSECAEKTFKLVRALRRLCPEAQVFASAATANDARQLDALGASANVVGGIAEWHRSGGERQRGGAALDTP